MSHDFEREERIQRWLNEPIEDDDDDIPVLEPCRVPKPCTVEVRPGNYKAAVRAGCEDEYDNQMQAKYGDGW